jgi:hypothetical protein
MLKHYFSILFLFVTVSGFSQKLLEKTLDASEIENIVIDANAVYSLSIISEKTNQISIKTKVAGEFYENVLVTTTISKNTLKISTAFSPHFVVENDKLAAHKVLSIEMWLVIPEFLNVSINSELASVIGTGNYEMLQIALETGSCNLHKFYGNARVRTKLGDIVVYAKKNVAGAGISKNGKIHNKLPKEGKYRVLAESKDGDVSLFQTK